MSQRRFWAELKTSDFNADNGSTIAILPVAAIEQHGPHLPLGTDTMIADGLVKRVASALPDKSPALFLPTLAIGKSTEHRSFPGTLTLNWTTFIKTLLDIGDSLAHANMNKLVIVTSHGGNTSSMETAGRELRLRHSMMVVSTAWEKLGMERTDSTDIHGGDLETSIMLALHPDLVDMDKAKNFKSAQGDLKSTNTHLAMHSADATISWLAEDLNSAGVVGDASAATAQKGEKNLQAATNGFLKLLQEVESHNWKK